MNRDLRLVDGNDNNVPDNFEDLDAADRATAGQARARRTGDEFDEQAFEYVEQAGATRLDHSLRIDGEVTVDALIVGSNRQHFWLIGHGTIDDGPRAGLKRTDTVLKTIGAAYLLSRKIDKLPLIVITSHLPNPTSAGGRQLADAWPLLWDVIAITDDLAGYHRLRSHLHDDEPQSPVDAPWMHSRPSVGGSCVGQLSFEGEDADA